MGGNVCAFADFERHLGHIFKVDSVWVAFDGTRLAENGIGFRIIGAFPDVGSAKVAVEFASLRMSAAARTSRRGEMLQKGPNRTAIDPAKGERRAMAPTSDMGISRIAAEIREEVDQLDSAILMLQRILSKRGKKPDRKPNRLSEERRGERKLSVVKPRSKSDEAEPSSSPRLNGF